jgi:hypothetical protein
MRGLFDAFIDLAVLRAIFAHAILAHAQLEYASRVAAPLFRSKGFCSAASISVSGTGLLRSEPQSVS